MSGREKRKRAVRYATCCHQTPEKLGEAREVPVGQSVVESGEICETRGPSDAGRQRRLSRQRLQVCESPVARRDEARVDVEGGTCIGGALRHPNGENEGEICPVFPLGAQIVRVAITQAVQQLVALPGILEMRAEPERGV